jgi:sec-independent protein translocase protein TatA
MGFLREPSHILLVVLVVVILFGSRRLPDAARGIGRSMRIFKSEMQEMKNDDKPRRPETGESAEPPLEGRVVRPTPTPTPTQPERTGETPRNL